MVAPSLSGPAAPCAMSTISPTRSTHDHGTKADADVAPGEIAVGGGRMRLPRVGALHGGHSGDVDIVLDVRRDAVEVPTSGCRRLGPGPIERPVGQAVQLRVDRLGAGDRRLDKFCRRHLAGLQALHQSDRIGIAQRVIAEGVHMLHGCPR